MKNKLSPRAWNPFSLLLLTTLFLCSGPGELRAQVSEAEKTQVQERASAHLDAGEYRQAMFYINRLLQWFPADPDYSYAAGKCKVELDEDLGKAIEYLTFAAVNAVPYDVFYYLGRAYFGQEQYGQAEENFNRFKRLATRKEISELKVDEYLLMCEHRADPQQNLLAGKEMERKEISLLESPPSMEKADESPAKEVASTGSAGEHHRMVAEGLNLQSRADSLERLHAIKLEEMRAAATPAQKNRLQSEAESIEMEMIKTRQQADARFREASLLADASLPGAASVPPAVAQAETPGGTIQDIPADLEIQASDRFYFEDPYRKMFRRNQLDKLEDITEMEEAGNLLMSRARESEQKAAEWKLKADGAGSSSQQKKFIARMKGFEEQALERKMEAVEYYQLVNEERYLLYKDALDRLDEPAVELREQMEVYRKRAEENYNRAQALRQEALQKTKEEERYQGLVEANAYELLTLENQKRAFESAAGKRIPETVLLADRQRETVKELPSGMPASVKEEKTFPVQETVVAIPEKKPEPRPQPREVATSEERIQEQEISASPPVETAPPVQAEIPVQKVETTRPPAGSSNGVDVRYRIQVGVFSAPKEASFFRGFGPVSSEPVPGKDQIRYFVGNWQLCEEADRTLARIRREGFDQAFLVATLNGNRVAISRARSLENTPVKESPPPEQGEIDWKVTEGAIPVYKIQVGAFRGTPTAEMEANFRRAAGTESVEKLRNEQGVSIYTIGNFYTFEDAVRFRNRLVTNGLKDAFVTAYLEGRRIPVEEARKMQNE